MYINKKLGWTYLIRIFFNIVRETVFERLYTGWNKHTVMYSVLIFQYSVSHTRRRNTYISRTLLMARSFWNISHAPNTFRSLKRRLTRDDLFGSFAFDSSSASAPLILYLAVEVWCFYSMMWLLLLFILYEYIGLSGKFVPILKENWNAEDLNF